jgi:hypothetical protein
MPADAEQKLAEFIAPLPQWLQKALWYSPLTAWEEYRWLDSLSPLPADELEELKSNPGWQGWQPERFPQTPEELRPRFEQLLQRCSREKWKAYLKNVKARRERLANNSVPLPKSPIGAPRKDYIAEEGARLRESGETWESAARKMNQKYGAGTVTKENLRSLLRSRRKSPNAAMVKTKL